MDTQKMSIAIRKEPNKSIRIDKAPQKKKSTAKERNEEKTNTEGNKMRIKLFLFKGRKLF